MKQFFSRSMLLAGVLGLTVAGMANATIITYYINANGAKEVSAAGVPNQGDPDGTAVGTVALDNVAGSAIINLVLANLAYPLTGFHIHQAPATTTGAIVLNFGNPETFRSGNNVSATVTGLSTTTISSVFADPTAFYFNLHNSVYPGGAVRDQLTVPEPASFGLAAAGLLIASLVRRRRAQVS
ncbi:MAG TPA: CHRD domain-containing protein [Bryobacteraceae bacterium]|nr:CHRD domain-containing protein [Bryobacteraceae bacterium]